MPDLSFLSDLYGIQPTQDYGTQMQPEQPDPVQSVNELLKTLETARPPEPHKLKTWQTVLGGLGDALQSMAAVRAGGSPMPVGPFAAGQREKRLTYQEQTGEFDKQMREARISAAEGVVGHQRDIELEEIRARGRQSRYMRPQLRLVDDKDEQGNPIKRPMLFDPETQTLTPMETTEGQGEFQRFVAPRTLSSPTGFQNMNPVTGDVTPITTGGGVPVYPQPPSGVVSDIAAGTANLQGLEALRSAYRTIRSETADSWDATKVAGTMAGETRLGGMLAPKYAAYTAARRASLNAYIKSVTGAQFSVAELRRYEGQYPEPWDDENLAEQKIQALQQRAVADMQAKMRAFPGAASAGPQQKSESVVDRAMRLAAEARARGGQSGSPNP